MLPRLDDEDRPRALYLGLSAVAQETQGAAPHFLLRPLPDTVADLDHAVPTVGQHNAEVLDDWLGYGADRVAALVAEGVL